MKRIALIGACSAEWVEKILEPFFRRAGCVWVNWTFPITDMQSTLTEQLAKHGFFRLYFYLSKKRGGEGFVEYVGLIDSFQSTGRRLPTPDPSLTPEPDKNRRDKTWLRVKRLVKLEEPLPLSKFKGLYSKRLSPSSLRSGFAYVEDFAV